MRVDLTCAAFFVDTPGMAKAKTVDPHPLDVIRRAKAQGIEKVICAVSGGKDSVANLALCCEHFGAENVRAYMMFFVAGLSFQEKYLRYLEGRFGVPILRLPHWGLTRLFRQAALRHPTPDAKQPRTTRIRDIENFVRVKTGVHWVATGERYRDSIQRQAQIKNCQGINPTRGRLYPVGYWTTAAVFNYLKSHQIALPGDYTAMRTDKSFGSLWAEQLIGIRDRYPDDWLKIKAMFPFVEAQIVRFELRKKAGRTNVR